ncbi:MAG: MBL fold metallo-hydrolase [Deltaproteobacteria bacterium]|nr:MBL fold metallo-hydrolase [Deltaproteobacteria bacterium]MBI3391117.1 MBL fold metallo-hydrolase [Deltaproteobacteria bacterium]
MSTKFTVRFWGVRGSIATGGPQYAEVGGNTTCVEVRAGNELIILDAGTGLFPLGQTLTGAVRASFLFSHFHWDHIQGLPLFRPAYQAGNEFTLFGQAADAAELEGVFVRQMQPPNFPVPMHALGAQFAFKALAAGDEFHIGPARIRTTLLHHPQSCLGYRISVGAFSVVFATDTEPREAGAFDPAVLDLARDADLLIHDGQYTTDEYNGHRGPCRKGWGHSTYEVACRVARWAGVKQLALFHHDPGHDDAFVEQIGEAACELFPNTIIAREGTTLDVTHLDAGYAEESRTSRRIPQALASVG